MKAEAYSHSGTRQMLILIFSLLFSASSLFSQKSESLVISGEGGLKISSVKGLKPNDILPVFSLYLQGEYFTSLDFSKKDGVYRIGALECHAGVVEDSSGIFVIIELINGGKDSLQVQGLLPFSEDPSHTRISPKSNSVMDNPWLFIPGELPMPVTLPGLKPNTVFCSAAFRDGLRISALCTLMPLTGSRTLWKPGYYLLYPGGRLEYRMRVALHKKGWEEGYRILQIEKDS